MANPIKGEKKLTTADKEYILFFDYNALAEIEDLTQETIPQVMQRLQDPNQVGVKFMRLLAWAGLQAHHEEEGLTIKDVGRILREAGTMSDVFRTIIEAFTACFAQEVEEAKKKGIDPQKELMKLQAQAK